MAVEEGRVEVFMGSVHGQYLPVHELHVSRLILNSCSVPVKGFSHEKKSSRKESSVKTICSSLSISFELRIEWQNSTPRLCLGTRAKK